MSSPSTILSLSCLVFGCSAASKPPVGEEPLGAWAPEGLEVVWHNTPDSLQPRAEWGESGLHPLADFVDEDGTTPYELVFEMHSGGPEQTGADDEYWEYPLHFGIGGPLIEDGKLHMFECSREGAVFDRGEYLAYCEPGTAILNIVYLADGRVPVADRPNPPDSIRQWWESTIAYDSDKTEFTIVTKFAYYGLNEEGYEVPVTFEPRAHAPPEPWDDPSIERWRVAKFDDR